MIDYKFYESHISSGEKAEEEGRSEQSTVAVRFGATAIKASYSDYFMARKDLLVLHLKLTSQHLP